MRTRGGIEAGANRPESEMGIGRKPDSDLKIPLPQKTAPIRLCAIIVALVGLLIDQRLEIRSHRSDLIDIL